MHEAADAGLGLNHDLLGSLCRRLHDTYIKFGSVKMRYVILPGSIQDSECLLPSQDFAFTALCCAVPPPFNKGFWCTGGSSMCSHLPERVDDRLIAGRDKLGGILRELSGCLRGRRSRAPLLRLARRLGPGRQLSEISGRHAPALHHLTVHSLVEALQMRGRCSKAYHLIGSGTSSSGKCL